jgi:hypothetical protein
MTQISLWRHPVANPLLDLLGFGKPSFLLARPDQLIADPNFEYATRSRL